MTRNDEVVVPADVAVLMANYFEVLWNQDMELFDKVFHKDCVLYGAANSELNIRPYEAYRNAVATRVAPANTPGDVRKDRIVLFDQISPNLALVKAQLQMFGGKMQDYLNICFVDGQWWVVAKMWERIGDAEV